MRKGMLVFTLRSALGDSTLNGVTTRYEKFVLTGEGIPEIFEPSAEAPELILDPITLGDHPTYFRCYPANPEVSEQRNIGGMAGGNYVKGSDSRMPFKYPIAVHDRYETQEQYDFLSR